MTYVLPGLGHLIPSWGLGRQAVDHPPERFPEFAATPDPRRKDAVSEAC